MATRTGQLDFKDYRRHTWGGPRPGAGRPRRTRRVHHVRRPRVPMGRPAHVTVRVRQGVPSLRARRFIRAFRDTLRRGRERGDFRVVHYSVQRNHVHLLVEAAGKPALGRGMNSISLRIALAIQRVFNLRGPVLDGRYHLRLLRTPREVRNALAYVLLNARRHWAQRHGGAPPVRLDEASSARWFDGWARTLGARPPPGPPEVAASHFWLLSDGWRRHRRIDPAEVPGRGAKERRNIERPSEA